MTTEREPVPAPNAPDVKALEKDLKEEEKENLKEMDEKKTADGQTKYAGGPIPK